MPPRLSKQHSSSILIETTPNLRQKVFPSQKRSVRKKPAQWSVRTARQGTITQMPALFDLYHPKPDQENLEYQEETQDTYQEPMPRSKKRKLSSEETPIRRVTRSTTKTATPAMKAEEPETLHREEVPVSPKADVGNPMPPPKTPSKPIRREIPSSQSPGGTPLSAESKRSERQVSRSPLKDKSVNMTNAPSPVDTPKRVRWAFKREVADSMESEGTSLSRISTKTSTDSLKTDIGQEKTPTQPIHHPHASPSTTNIPVPPTFDTATENVTESIIQVPSSPQPPEETNYDSSPANSPPINTNPVRFDFHDYDSQDPSNQLQTDLQHNTFPSHLQTDSQFESGWHDYDPRPSSEPQYISSSQLISTKASASDDFNDASPPSTISTQLLPRSHTDRQADVFGTQNASGWQQAGRLAKTADEMKRRNIVPPSQATTIDATQPSSSSKPQYRTRLPSPPLLLSSSPATNVGSRGGGKEWKTQPRLADSQLFPESLLNGTLPAPPTGWGLGLMGENGEFLVEEEDEEEEIDEIDEIED